MHTKKDYYNDKNCQYELTVVLSDIFSDTGDDGNAQYIAFVLVPVFFLLGLLGVLICHILKRKGYRCTTEAEENELVKDEDEMEKDPEKGGEGFC